jgi:hypothetical protein
MVVGFGLIIAANLPTAATADVYVGALVVERGPGLDQVTGGQHVGRNFMATWQAYQSGRVHGAHVHGRIYLSTNGRQQTLYNGGINGMIKLQTSNRIEPATCLCVEVYGQTSCTHPGEAYNFVQRGGARSAADAWGVALMVP